VKDAVCADRLASTICIIQQEFYPALKSGFGLRSFLTWSLSATVAMPIYTQAKIT